MKSAAPPTAADPVDLSVRVGSLALTNPIIAASGCFGWGTEYSDIFSADELGGFVTKGLSLNPRTGNPPPRIAETPSGMLNSIGIESVGVDEFLRNKLPQIQALRTAVIVNLFGETEDEYVEIARRLADPPGLAALELNASCPNTTQGGLEFGIDPTALTRLTRRVRQVTSLPLWVKLTPNVTDIVAVARAAQDGGADAVTAINTLRGMAIDIARERPVLSTRFGGLSGPAIRPVALAMVYQLRRALPSLPIVGGGGIVSARDVAEFMLAGASAVQIGTALFSNPLAFLEIKSALSQLCRERAWTHVSALTGRACR